jgi:hypothetical protein
LKPSPDTQGQLRNRDEGHGRTHPPSIWQREKEILASVYFPGEEGVFCRTAEPVK